MLRAARETLTKTFCSALRAKVYYTRKFVCVSLESLLHKSLLHESKNQSEGVPPERLIFFLRTLAWAVFFFQCLLLLALLLLLLPGAAGSF